MFEKDAGKRKIQNIYNKVRALDIAAQDSCMELL